jgi:hypothetical protein
MVANKGDVPGLDKDSQETLNSPHEGNPHPPQEAAEGRVAPKYRSGFLEGVGGYLAAMPDWLRARLLYFNVYQLIAACIWSNGVRFERNKVWMIVFGAIFVLSALFIDAVISSAQAITECVSYNLNSIGHNYLKLPNIGGSAEAFVVSINRSTRQSIAEFSSMPPVKNIEIFSLAEQKCIQRFKLHHTSGEVSYNDGAETNLAMWRKAQISGWQSVKFHFINVGIIAPNYHLSHFPNGAHIDAHDPGADIDGRCIARVFEHGGYFPSCLFAVSGFDNLNLIRGEKGAIGIAASFIGAPQNYGCDASEYGKDNCEKTKTPSPTSHHMLIGLVLGSLLSGCFISFVLAFKVTEYFDEKGFYFWWAPLLIFTFSGIVFAYHFLAALDRRAENVIVEAVIVAELELRNVKMQILFADVVEGANDAALDDTPKALNRVRVNRAGNVFASGVVNNGVLREALMEVLVPGKPVGADQANLVRNGFTDECLKRRGSGILDDASDHVALALDRANNDCLSNRASPFMKATLVPMPVLGLAADVGFVNLHNTAQLGFRLDQGNADFVSHQPSSFDRAKAHVAPKLADAHSLFAGEHQVSDLEPVAKRLVRVLKDRARDAGEAVAIWRTFAALPVEAFVRRCVVKLRIAAARAIDAVGPAARDQIGLAGFVIANREHVVKLSRRKLVDRLGATGGFHGDTSFVGEYNHVG